MHSLVLAQINSQVELSQVEKYIHICHYQSACILSTNSLYSRVSYVHCLMNHNTCLASLSHKQHKALSLQSTTAQEKISEITSATNFHMRLAPAKDNDSDDDD